MKLALLAVRRVARTLSVPSTRVYAMKPGGTIASNGIARTFSTLDSGLRDETVWTPRTVKLDPPFSTLDSGLRDETDNT